MHSVYFNSNYSFKQVLLIGILGVLIFYFFFKFERLFANVLVVITVGELAIT